MHSKTDIHCYTSNATTSTNMTTVTEVGSASTHLFPAHGMPWSVITTLHYVVKTIFHHRVWYRALSLHYACIQSLGIILIPWAIFVPNLVSLATSIAELAHGEKLHTGTQSLTQSPSLFSVPGTEALDYHTDIVEPAFSSNPLSPVRILTSMGKSKPPWLS